MFKNLLLKAASWLLKQSLGGTRGTAAVAKAAPVLATIAGAAGKAAAVRIDHAAATGGDLGKVVSAVQTAQAIAEAAKAAGVKL